MHPRNSIVQQREKPVSVIVENGRSACGLRESRVWQTADLESSHWAAAQGPEMWMTWCVLRPSL